jgi:hypothetical protein
MAHDGGQQGTSGNQYEAGNYSDQAGSWREQLHQYRDRHAESKQQNPEWCGHELSPWGKSVYKILQIAGQPRLQWENDLNPYSQTDSEPAPQKHPSVNRPLWDSSRDT